MNAHHIPLSTGLASLDQMILGLRPGDNVVWKVDTIEDYAVFVAPYARYARENGIRLIYFRFAHHPALVAEEEGVETIFLQPGAGFEQFIIRIHDVIQSVGEGGYYVFDSLSELALDCYSDRMVGNFFLLTCPYLYKQKAIAYFAVLRHYHSRHAALPIEETTQLLMAVYRHREKCYVHPLKVLDRYSPTLHMLHTWENGTFTPVTQSARFAEVLQSAPWAGLESARYQMGVWNRVFAQAENLLERTAGEGKLSPQVEEMFHRILGMAFSRDERVLRLARKYFTLADLLKVRKRMIGTGYIGGKTVGMLLARAILRRNDPCWEERLETHDSFYIGSEVFYTYLVLNDCWWVRKKQKDPAAFMDYTGEARRRIQEGKFPDYMMHRFKDMLEYYGQSPIIVRSSSLLEDNFGNAFAGQYESVFLTNQGSREKRLEEFVRAVQRIYASSMSEKALLYRAQHGILDRDEQMALLVQRVSGGLYGKYYYPQAAGVGYSHNPYVWSQAIDAKAGVIRLVFGLGTRAVERSEDDFTRIVALNAPDRRPEVGMQEVRRYTQKKCDVLNLESQALESHPFSELIEQSPGLPLGLYLSPDELQEWLTRTVTLKERFVPTLCLDNLIRNTPLIEDLSRILQALEEAYAFPVDIEFTVNVHPPDSYKINLLQCRPFQFRGGGVIQDPPADVKREDILLESHGAVIGRSRIQPIQRVIFISPEAYGQMPLNDRYSIARLIGQLTRLHDNGKRPALLLIGPGRWGTTTPSLGVPVSFAEIAGASVLCEVVAMREDLTPDVSLGTHFFSNIVELDILYLALFPDQEHNALNMAFLEQAPNRLADLIPSAARHEKVIHVIDMDRLPQRARLLVHANNLTQGVMGYLG